MEILSFKKKKNDIQLIYYLLITALFFRNAKVSECQKLLQILLDYEKATWQKVNRGKTNLFLQQINPTRLGLMLMG